MQGTNVWPMWRELTLIMSSMSFEVKVCNHKHFFVKRFCVFKKDFIYRALSGQRICVLNYFIRTSIFPL